MPVPSFSRHSLTMSPPPSESPTFTPSQQKLNVVTRLAVEGKAKHGDDGASIKMYLKIALPLDSVSPGSTIPLFPEANVKIMTSQVHPIDNNSVPYDFSSTICPMLHNAARALNLPSRSPQSYLSLFGLSAPASSARSSIPRHSSSSAQSTTSNPAALDDKYTGHIVVSGYNVSYVLPKEFPPRSREGSSYADHDSTPVSYKMRRSSIGERNVLQFMAAVDIWVPYVSRPPRAPFLLSIPTPRCLSNNIKLRIFPPKTTSTSFASLSSAEDETNSWDLTSDPHVTRTATSRPSRTGSYTHFADDESSDSSTTAGFSDGCGIQGTFPSAEHIRVRWAAPMKTVNVPDGGDGRRRVGVREVKGEMACVVIGKRKDKSNGAEGLLMNVEYKGKCKGVWFPGVATMLGMDVGLEAKGSDVSWVGPEQKWTVSGGQGYTGYDVGAKHHPISRQSSFDSPRLGSQVPGLRPDGRHDSATSASSSTSSLLRAPLPAQNVAEYSFEGSATSSAPSGTLSSMSITSTSPNGTRSRVSSINGVDGHLDLHVRPPAVPITIHLNMNDLLPPAKNELTFEISGTILVTPRPQTTSNLNTRSSSPVHSDIEVDPEPIVLPVFSVLAADTETTSTVIRNDVESATVEVYNSSGDIRDAQTRKTVLQKGGFTRCGADGGRIALRAFRSLFPSKRFTRDHSAENGHHRPRTPNGIPRVSSSSSLKQAYRSALTRPRRDGPLMIPSVVATVTILHRSPDMTPNAYAVRVCLPAPSDADSEWLEFGLAQPSPNESTLNVVDENDGRPPHVEIASASIDGIPVRFETTAAVKQESNELAGLGVPFDEMSGKEWVSWVRVHVGDVGGGNVQVDYLVKNQVSIRKKGKDKAKDDGTMDIFLPAFSLPVGRLEVNLESISDLEILHIRSNLSHQRLLPSGRRLLHFSTDELFYPRLSVTLYPAPYRNRSALFQPLGFLLSVTPILISIVLLFCLMSLGAELRQIRRNCSTGSEWNDHDIANPVTVTSTVLRDDHSQWWFGGTPNILATPEATSSPTSPSRSSVTSLSTPTPTSSSWHGETDALIPIDAFTFPWLQQFDFSVDSVLRSLGTIWQVLRKVYHYPLDPP